MPQSNGKPFSYLESFLAKVDRSGNCWIWTASVHSSGYGNFGFRGTMWKSHRASYALLVSEIPPGLHVLHRCDNKLCCNPEHLFLGTHKDNMADMVAKGRHAHGSSFTSSKLTESRVVELRRRYVPGTRWVKGNCKELCAEFGIKRGTLYQTVARKWWRHVP